MNEDTPIKITTADVERVTLPTAPSQTAPRGRVDSAAGLGKSYGSLGPAPTGGFESVGAGGFFRRSWVYLGLAGMVGSLLAWAMCEPFFAMDQLGNESIRGLGRFLIPLVVVLMCMGFAAAESWVERSLRKGLQRAVLAFVLGAVLGLFLGKIADVLFTALLWGLVQGSAQPLFPMMASRSVAWGLFGVASGLVYGLAGKSSKKCLYGVIGGVLGAFIGGLLFDPISMLTRGGGASRAIGLALFGLCTGAAMGLVESALKDRWLYVSSGPLAGKQFILYKSTTLIGSAQASDIYLFKDQSILPTHAAIEIRGAQALLTAGDAVLVNGQSVQERTLRSGDQIQIGRYTFDYQEKAKRS